MQLVMPVSNVLVPIAVLLCADDTDLCAFDERGDSAEEVVAKV